jgi:hypothetical protein
MFRLLDGVFGTRFASSTASWLGRKSLVAVCRDCRVVWSGFAQRSSELAINE